jgi:hypothetical protein
MGIEQYISRELKEDIKRLIRKVTELDKKIEELKASQKVYTLSHNASGDVYTESKRMQDELEPIDNSKPEQVDETFKRYAQYNEWNKSHDSYKILHSPTNTDEHGKKIKDD